MLKKDYDILEYGDLVRPNGGPLRGLVLQVVNAEGGDIFTQQENNPAFVYVRNYRAFDILHHFTDLEKYIQRLHDSVWDRNPLPDRGRYPIVEGTVSRDYYMKKADVQFRNRNEERITQGLYYLLSENGVQTLEDLCSTSPEEISKMRGLDSVTTIYICAMREKVIQSKDLARRMALVND